MFIVGFSIHPPAQDPPACVWDHADLEPLVIFIQDAIREKKLRPDPLVPVQVTPSREVFEQVRARWEGQRS